MNRAHLVTRGQTEPLCNVRSHSTSVIHIQSREHLRFAMATAIERPETRRQVCKNCLRSFNRRYA